MENYGKITGKLEFSLERRGKDVDGLTNSGGSADGGSRHVSPVTIAVVRVGVVVHKVPPVAGSRVSGVRPPVKLLVGLPKAGVHRVNGDPLAGATRVRVLAVKRQGPFDCNFLGGRGG